MKGVEGYHLNFVTDCDTFNCLAMLFTEYREYGSFLLARLSLRYRIGLTFNRLCDARIAFQAKTYPIAS